MKKIISLLLIILVSGCIGGGGLETSQTDGLVLKDFSINPKKAESGEQVALSIDIQNLGGKTATAANLHIFGTPFIDPVSCVSNPGFCIIDDGNYPLEDKVKPRWEVGSLLPPDQTIKLEGEKRTNLLLLGVPCLSQGITSDYNLISRLCYKYSTTAQATVDVISVREKLIEQQKGTYKQEAVNLDNSAGPIQIDVKTRQPLITYGESRDTRLSIIVKNVGGGTVFNFDRSTCTNPVPEIEDLNRVRISRVIIGNEDITDSCTPELVSILPTSKEGVINCDWSPEAVAAREQKQVEVTVEYGYYVDKETTLQVTGAEPEACEYESVGVPVTTKKKQVSYISFDKYDYLDVVELEEKEVVLKFSDTIEFLKQIESKCGFGSVDDIDWDDECVREDISDNYAKTLDFYIIPKSDSKYSRVEFTKRPTIQNIYFKPEACEDRSTSSCDTLIEPSNKERGYLFSDVFIGDMFTRSYYHAGKGSSTGIYYGAPGDPTSDFNFKLFNPVFVEGEIGKAKIQFKFDAIKTDGGTETRERDITRTLTISLSETDYSKEFTLKGINDVKEPNIAKGESNIDGKCRFKLTELENTNNKCAPKIESSCSGGIVDLASESYGHYIMDGSDIEGAPGQTVTNLFDSKTSKQIGYRFMDDNTFSEYCKDKKIKVYLEAVDIDCEPDNLGDCESEKAACHEYDYKFKVSLEGLDCKVS